MRSPAALAQDITPFLPHPMDPADLAQLKTTERKPLTKKGLARLPEIVQKTTPAKPKQNPEDEGTVPFYKSRQEEQFRTGQTGERTFSVPVGQILDVGREMAKPPQKKPQAQKKPEKKPAAEPDLVPDPNKSPKLPNLAHVTAVLTSALESAPKDKPAVDVRLEAEYGTLGEKDTAAVFSRLTEMLAVLRELRPELVRGVSKINVFFGAKLARTIPVAAEGKK